MQVDPRQEIAMGFLPQELDSILQALGQRPYVEVAVLINKIQSRIVASLTPPALTNDTDPGAGPEPQG